MAREAGVQQFFAQEQLHNSFQQTATEAAVSQGSFVSQAFATDAVVGRFVSSKNRSVLNDKFFCFGF